MMLTVEEARKRMLDTVSVSAPEKRGILDCLGHVLAEDIFAEEHIPPFDNSAMDGFAVIAEDVRGASEETPVSLAVIESIAAGYAPAKRIDRGHAARIMTGAMMPVGADAVVMQEVTQFERGTGSDSGSGGKGGKRPVHGGEREKRRSRHEQRETSPSAGMLNAGFAESDRKC